MMTKPIMFHEFKSAIERAKRKKRSWAVRPSYVQHAGSNRYLYQPAEEDTMSFSA
jgi:hypothetical protein